MKQSTQSKNQSIQFLMQAISLLKDEKEALDFFADLCTPAELEAMTDRWLVVPLIREGIPYRTIHERTGVSVTTITRVARCLSFGSGGYQLIAERLEKT